MLVSTFTKPFSVSKDGYRGEFYFSISNASLKDEWNFDGQKSVKCFSENIGLYLLMLLSQMSLPFYFESYVNMERREARTGFVCCPISRAP